MKSKKKIAIPVIAVILGVICILLCVYPRIINNLLIKEYQSQKLELYSQLNIVSDSFPVDGNPDSLSGFKEAVRLGADTVTMNLCFKNDGTPVICENYDLLTDDTLKAEEIFKLMNEDNYIDTKVNFRIRQLGSLTVFNFLISEYDLSDRVILSGIDESRYSLLHGTDTPAGLYFDYNANDDINACVEEVNTMIADYGIRGVIVDDADAQLVDAFCQKGISFIVSDVDDEIDMYRLMSYGAYYLETDNPDKMSEIYASRQTSTLDDLDKSILDELNK